MIDKQSQCLRVNTLSYYLIGGLTAPLCLFFGVTSWLDGGTQAPLLCVFMAVMTLMNLVLCLMGGTTELTDDCIRTFTPLGSYELAWAEIRGLVFEPYNFSLFLFAEGKQLYVPAPKAWSGKDKHRARMFLIEQLKLHQVPIVQEPRSLIFSRSCKIHKSVND